MIVDRQYKVYTVIPISVPTYQDKTLVWAIVTISRAAVHNSISHRVTVLGNGCTNSQGAGAAVLQLIDLPLSLWAVVNELNPARGEFYQPLLCLLLLHYVLDRERTCSLGRACLEGEVKALLSNPRTWYTVYPLNPSHTDYRCTSRRKPAVCLSNCCGLLTRHC